MNDPIADLIRQVGAEKVLLQLINHTHGLDNQDKHVIQLRSDLLTAYTHYSDRHKPQNLTERVSSIGQRLRKMWKPDSRI